MHIHLKILALSAILGLTAIPSQAGEDPDDIVRLPGQSMQSPGSPYRPKADRKQKKLVAGGGLMTSFDHDNNGLITGSELASGVKSAFHAADANEDGYLSALEQIAWANSLEVRDDTLSNPVRFDPNLDRRVSYNEFKSVIASLAADYAGESGDIRISDLKAPEEKPPREDADLRPPYGPVGGY